MSVFSPFTGMPGFGTEKIASHRTVAADGYLQFLPGGQIGDGSKLRDPDNPDYNSSTNPLGQYRLRAGLIVGKVTSGSKWANSVVGVTNGAITGAGTTVTFASAQQVTELLRRLGASTGTFKLTGPPVASGVVRTLTATFSALSGTTATITALGVNQVEQIRLAPASTGGNLQLTIQKPDGTYATTGSAAWNATDATYLANIQAVLDAATGVVNGIVASAIAATDTDNGIVLTYSGTGYAGLPWTPAKVSLLPTTSTDWYHVPVTTAVDGRFVTGSFIQPTDGSEVIRSFLGDGWEMHMPTDGSDIPLNQLAIEGNVDASQLLPLPADASLKQWVRDQLNTYGKFVFTEKY